MHVNGNLLRANDIRRAGDFGILMQQHHQRYFGPSEGLKVAFNRAPLLIEHHLTDHPLLSVEAIAALAERLSWQSTPRGFFVLPTGQPHPGVWGSTSFRQAVSAGFANFETSGMRLKLSSVHLEPGYRELLNESTAQLDALTGGALLREFPQPLATLFITSPGQITPYHVDSEINFLFQIAGTKTVHIYDGTDRSLVGARELERYWTLGQIEMPDGITGSEFALRPGIGVHNPVHFPHWVQNGPMPSISLSLGFVSREDLSDVFRVNYQLRRLGFSPAEPGSQPRFDGAKRVTMHATRCLRNLIKGRKTPLIKLQ